MWSVKWINALGASALRRRLFWFQLIVYNALWIHLLLGLWQGLDRANQQTLFLGLRLLLGQVDILIGALSLAHRRCRVDWGWFSLLFLIISFTASQVLLVLCGRDTVTIGRYTRLWRLVSQGSLLNKFLNQVCRVGRQWFLGLGAYLAENLLDLRLQLI